MQFEASFAFDVPQPPIDPAQLPTPQVGLERARESLCNPHLPDSDEELSEISETEELQQGSVGEGRDERVQTETLKRNVYFDKPRCEDAAPMGFASLNLSKPLLKACEALQYTVATPIQAAAIPLILSGRDICGSAITGSGKTAAFGLPLLERLLYRPTRVATTYVLMVAPTRELAVQIHDVMRDLAQFTDIQIALVVGGFSLQVQSATLATHPEIIVATPGPETQLKRMEQIWEMPLGRLIDHLRNSRSFDLEDVHAVVLDEADKLLKMGFIHEVGAPFVMAEIKEILKHLPKKRQTMLFSATMTEEVKKLMQLSLHKPVRIAANPSGRVPRKLTQVDRTGPKWDLLMSSWQEVIRVKGEDMRKQKEAILCALCSRTFVEGRVIIFCSTKSRAHRIKLLFEMLKLPPIGLLYTIPFQQERVQLGELHSNMSQTARLDSLEKFRNREVSYLVATDVAGRGLDIVGVEVVINYDAPPSLDTYLHRIGRTARAGAEGQAVTFITDTNRELLKEILAATQQKLTQRIIPAEAISYYEQQIQLHQRHLQLVEKQEMENSKISHAEMEAERAKNVIEHEKEILAKPPRTWFQTKEERKEMKKLARMEDEGVLGPSTVLEVEPTAKKGKKMKKGEQRAQQNPEMAETKMIKGKVRAIKQLHRLYEGQGSTSKAASKRALASVVSKTGQKRQRGEDDEELGFLKDPSAMKRSSKRGAGRAQPDLDDQEAVRKPHVYAGGARSRRVHTQSINKQKLNLIKRGGKGKHAFKGKSKYKRR